MRAVSRSTGVAFAAAARSGAHSAPRAAQQRALLSFAALRQPARPLAPRAVAGVVRRTMFIQVQDTPNPNTMMFRPGVDVMGEGKTAVFESARDGMRSPLARSLFQIEGCEGVFFGAEFISVTKGEESQWDVLKPMVFEAVMDFYASGQEVCDEGAVPSDTEILDDDDEVVALIKELLDARIRPSVQEDGGDISYIGFEDGVVQLQLQGACTTCPSSTATLKGGIENMLMHYIPEVLSVEQVGGFDADPNEVDGVLSHKTMD